MIKQLQLNDLKELFTHMDIQDRSLMLGMVNETVNKTLVDLLN